MANPVILDQSGTPVPPEQIAAVRAQIAGAPPARDQFPSPAYRAAGYGEQELYTFRPALHSGDSSVLPNRNVSVARMRDQVRNDPHGQAAVTRLVDMLIGAGLRLSSTPDARALGLDPSKATDRTVVRDLAKNIESEWRLVSNDPLRQFDAQRKLTPNALWRLMGRSYCSLNETTALIAWRPDPTARYATCVLAIDPDRLSNPYGRPDWGLLRGGIEFDEFGAPLAYHVRNAHPADWYMAQATFTWTRVERRTPWGRPQFVHAFEPDREGQSRGMTPFAALVVRLRMINKHADIEIANATANALFAAFVKSNLPIGEVGQSLTPHTSTFADKRHGYYERIGNPTLGGVRIPVLPIGDEIQINSSSRPTSSFASFQTAFLRSIAAGIGTSYEQLSMDWSQTNYSSARAALNEVWRHIQALLSGFTDQVVIPIYTAWLEEAFDRGYVMQPPGAPEFWDAPGAYVASRWIGPGRGYVDPVKEAQAAAMRMDSLVSTLQRECAEQGLDYEEILDQIAAEEAELKDRGIERRALNRGEGDPQPQDVPEEARPGQPPQEPSP